MTSSMVIFHLLFSTFSIFSSFPSTSTAASSTNLACFDTNCSSSPAAATIRYPFRLANHQPPPCGYPGFDLSCDDHSLQTPVLNLPHFGNLSVQNIDYLQQEILLDDPNNCLPKRILSHPLDLSNSPFHGKYYRAFSLYNCSSIDQSASSYHYLERIDCLSGSNYTVVSISNTWNDYNQSDASVATELLRVPSSCEGYWIADIGVPVVYTAYGYSTLLPGILLGWGDPDCGRRCERRGERCQPKGEGGRHFDCSGDPSPVISRLMMALVFALVGALLVVFTLAMFFACNTLGQRHGLSVTGSDQADRELLSQLKMLHSRIFRRRPTNINMRIDCVQLAVVVNNNWSNSEPSTTNRSIVRDEDFIDNARTLTTSPSTDQTSQIASLDSTQESVRANSNSHPRQPPLHSPPPPPPPPSPPNPPPLPPLPPLPPPTLLAQPPPPDLDLDELFSDNDQSPSISPLRSRWDHYFNHDMLTTSPSTDQTSQIASLDSTQELDRASSNSHPGQPPLHSRPPPPPPSISQSRWDHFFNDDMASHDHGHLANLPRPPHDHGHLSSSRRGNIKVDRRQQMIDSLPREVVDERKSNLSADGKKECGICKEEYQLGETKRRLRCMHSFHAGCVDPWLLTNPTCPCCRNSL